MDEPAVLFGEWPLTLSRKRVGERIRQLTDSGRVRHDLLVDKSRVGRIIGQRGSTLQALLQVLSKPSLKHSLTGSTAGGCENRNGCGLPRPDPQVTGLLPLILL